MTSDQDRRAIVDDTDSKIIYADDNSWFLDASGAKDDVGNFGKALNSTLHGTAANSSFTYTFSGTAINVVGLTDVQKIANGVGDPSWECFIDGTKIDNTSPFFFTENNWNLCGKSGLFPGNHTLTVKSHTTKGRIFWFDYVSYTPVQQDPLKDALISVPETDPAVVYDATWAPLGDYWRMTHIHNGSMSFNFTGTRVSWVGMYPTEMPSTPALGQYSIDGGKTVDFVLKGSGGKNMPTSYNQLLFQSDILPEGSHHLVVNFLGGNDTTCLALDYLLVQTGSSSLTTGVKPTSSPSPALPSANASSAASSNSARSARIACAVLFPLLFICLVIIFLYKRHQRRSRKIVQGPASKDFTLGSPSQRTTALEREADTRRETWSQQVQAALSSTLKYAQPSHWKRMTNGAPQGQTYPSRWSQPRKFDGSVNFDSTRKYSWKSPPTPSPLGQEPHELEGGYQPYGVVSHTPGIEVVERNAAAGPSTWKDVEGSSLLPKGAALPHRASTSKNQPQPPPFSPNEKDDGSGYYYGGYQTKKEIMEQEKSAKW